MLFYEYQGYYTYWYEIREVEMLVRKMKTWKGVFIEATRTLSQMWNKR
jgi:hypothetical protein